MANLAVLMAYCFWSRRDARLTSKAACQAAWVHLLVVRLCRPGGHMAAVKGTVKRILFEKGFGFVADDAGRE